MKSRSCASILLAVSLAVAGCTRTSDCSIPNWDISKFDTLSNDYKRAARVHISGCGATPVEDSEQGAKVKTRGGYSIGFPKKNFTVSLDEAINIGDWPASRHWILGATYIDKTFLRNKLAYDLFREFDDRNIAPRSMFVTVSIDGDYNGLYVLNERMDKQRLALDTAFGACIFKDPMIFIDSLTDNEQPPDDYFHQKHPDLDVMNMNSVMYSVWEFLKYSTDNVFANAVAAWFDIRCVVDWHLLLLVSNNGDGVKKNFYIYRRSADRPFEVCPWDYDGSFGRDGDNELQRSSFPDWQQASLLRRLTELNVDGYNQRVLARYRQLKQRGILTTEHFMEMIESNLQIIRPSVEENFSIWPENVGWPYFDANSFEQEVELIQKWMASRIDTLDALFVRWEGELLVED